MGQSLSDPEPQTIESLSNRLTETFATKCLTPFELYIFKSVFKKYATTSSGVSYWNQQTLNEFLELPNHPNIPIGHVLFHLVTYVGAFPFPSQAPAILTNDALLRMVVVLTKRHTKVLRANQSTWEREIWRALAVFDREFDEKPESKINFRSKVHPNDGFKVDVPVDDSDNENEHDNEDDELVLAAFDAMDAMDIFKHGDVSNTKHAMVPPDNFLTLIMFLLLLAPISSQESPSLYTKDLTDERLEDLRYHAHSILMSFGVENHPGITYSIFKKVVSESLPHLFEPLRLIFEHFFHSNEFDLHQKTRESVDEESSVNKSSRKSTERSSGLTIVTSPSPSPCGDLLTPACLSHLSFILPPSILFRNLTLLFDGATHGFSMPTFQNCVFNWNGPSILLVSGSVMTQSNDNSQDDDFLSSLPHRKLKQSATEGSVVTYGVYLSVPWKESKKVGFGSSETLLFQLYPQHDLFQASSSSSTNAYFLKSPATYPGIGFGSPLAERNTNTSSIHSSISNSLRRGSTTESDKIPLGPVSLHMDDTLTYGVFTHDSKGNGSIQPSSLPKSCRLDPSLSSSPDPSVASTSIFQPSQLSSSTTNKMNKLASPVTSPPNSPTTTSPKRIISPFQSAKGQSALPLLDYQTPFIISSIEVYGLGGTEVAEAQNRAKAWEVREAERRKGIQRSGDIEGDKEILRMAGLLDGDTKGGGRSGGSMG